MPDKNIKPHTNQKTKEIYPGYTYINFISIYAMHDLKENIIIL